MSSDAKAFKALTYRYIYVILCVIVCMCITIIVFLMHYLDHFLAINPIKRFKNSSYIRSKVARKKKNIPQNKYIPCRVYMRCANRLFIRKESNLAKIQTYRIVLDLPPTLHHKTYYYVGNYVLTFLKFVLDKKFKLKIWVTFSPLLLWFQTSSSWWASRWVRK